MKITRIKRTDIPAVFLETATRCIFNYTIGLVNLTEKGGKEEAKILGSGTLVAINGIHGILTAGHVIDALPSDEKIGFVICERLHKFSIEIQRLSLLTIAKAQIESEGPDIGFIKIPDAMLGQIKALKSFYNLRKRLDNINSIIDTDHGIWCICGFPEIFTCHEGPNKGFEEIISFTGFCVFGNLLEQYTNKNFDYYDFEILYNKNNKLPNNLEGVSGGGLWQVIIEQNLPNKFFVKDIILSGIPFYQTKRFNDKRKVKCHARKSIYKYSFEFIENNYS